MKIYLSPSNQVGNTYSAGNTNECDQCNKIARFAEEALKRCGFDVKRALKGQEMNQSISESNNWGADVHLAIHTNAGGGSGPLVMVRKKDQKRLAYATPVYNALFALCGRKKGYGVRLDTEVCGNLAELKNTGAIGVYCECEFHDNKQLAQWIVDNVEQIGEAICQGICKGAKVEYIPPQAPVFYRVQVGAFNDVRNAEAMKTSLQKDGYKDAFVVSVSR